MRRRFTIVMIALLLGRCPALRAEDSYFDSDGVKIHYIVEGAGEPLVLIHGFALNLQMQWGLHGLIGDLSKDYQVIALDNRGHGQSGKPHEADKYGAQMSEDVVRLLEHLKVDKAHVVGYSMGGFITAKLLASHPERLRSATIGGAGWPRPGEGRLNLLKELAESLDAGKGIGPLIIALTPADRPKPTPEQISTINQLLMFTNDEKALAAVVRGLPQLAVTEAELKANKVPTLALIGSADPLKRDVDAMAERMANLQVTVIEGADHMTTVGSALFRSDLRKFLEAHAATPSQPAPAEGAAQ